ncbi:hypothetical protein WN51_03548 [Melipona quadrifasciata]|uniref:Uncharacterized protein n=1 Tax=Melipona quadrifasciata TaxID=166423 RepID=A0A0M8ZU58_9HYME|nr:hypothetical protein WN51_03548 [Melipona quadrifasciata]
MHFRIYSILTLNRKKRIGYTGYLTERRSAVWSTRDEAAVSNEESGLLEIGIAAASEEDPQQSSVKFRFSCKHIHVLENVIKEREKQTTWLQKTLHLIAYLTLRFQISYNKRDTEFAKAEFRRLKDIKKSNRQDQTLINNKKTARLVPQCLIDENERHATFSIKGIFQEKRQLSVDHWKRNCSLVEPVNVERITRIKYLTKLYRIINSYCNGIDYCCCFIHALLLGLRGCGEQWKRRRELISVSTILQ